MTDIQKAEQWFEENIPGVFPEKEDFISAYLAGSSSREEEIKELTQWQKEAIQTMVDDTREIDELKKEIERLKEIIVDTRADLILGNT